ncbi:hypothetical protein BDQ17DRAFT_1453433 [Cyathus striatus]|nr:hypothetical protein BDQ17DRAFT_1453433 [Cyathus striatus]
MSNIPCWSNVFALGINPFLSLYIWRIPHQFSDCSVILTATTIIYDELELSYHWMTKNLCAVFGYSSFEAGATMLLSNSPSLNSHSVKAIALSSIIIFTTIHAQDFSDVDGDRTLGRVTFPMYAPELSRVTILVAPPLWSWALIHVWNINPFRGYLF